MDCDQKELYHIRSEAVTPAPVRFPTQRPLVPSFSYARPRTFRLALLYFFINNTIRVFINKENNLILKFPLILYIKFVRVKACQFINIFWHINYIALRVLHMPITIMSVCATLFSITTYQGLVLMLSLAQHRGEDNQEGEICKCNHMLSVHGSELLNMRRKLQFSPITRFIFAS